MDLGFIVDAVSEVLGIPADSVEPPPRLSVTGRECLSGTGKLIDRVLIIRDAGRTFSGSEEGEEGMIGTIVGQASA
jgi:purine-binding chemotaxis protein CheW